MTYSYVPNQHRLWTVGVTERNYNNAGYTTRTGRLTKIIVDDPLPVGKSELENASYG